MKEKKSKRKISLKISKIKKNKKQISAKIERVPTGINGFDKLVEGGFEKKSINLITGGSGSGKTIFSVQFLIEGVNRGESVLYVAFEEKKEEFYENMKNSGIDLEKAEKTGKFMFLEYSPEKVKMMLDEGGGSIESIIIKNNIQRMIIDSITSFSLLFPDELSKRQACIALFDIIRKWNCTTLFTAQHNPSDREEKNIPSVEFEADSIILLYYASINNKRERFIEILKMKGTNHSREIHKFEITKKGIIIGAKAKVNKEELKD